MTSIRRSQGIPAGLKRLASTDGRLPVCFYWVVTPAEKEEANITKRFAKVPRGFFRSHQSWSVRFHRDTFISLPASINRPFTSRDRLNAVVRNIVFEYKFLFWSIRDIHSSTLATNPTVNLFAIFIVWNIWEKKFAKGKMVKRDSIVLDLCCLFKWLGFSSVRHHT